MNLFYMKNNNNRIEIGILGIKIKIKTLNNIEERLKNLEKGSRFTYSNYEMLTSKDYKNLICEKFYRLNKYILNLKNPKTFNEKIQWLILHYYNPQLHICSDKSLAKEYFIKKGLEKYIIPTIGIWTDIDDIDFEKLPEQFVIKNTMGGAAKGVRIIKNKSKTNIEKLKYDLVNMLLPWQFEAIIPMPKWRYAERLIVEKYIKSLEGDVVDYKIFCFNGQPKLVEIIANRFSKKSYDYIYYDINWNYLNIKASKLHKKLPKQNKPKNFDKMIEIAKILSEDFPFCRVDLYNIDGTIYIGEMTFEPAGGYKDFPIEWDYKLGEMLDISNIDSKYLTNDIVQTMYNAQIPDEYKDICPKIYKL